MLLYKCSLVPPYQVQGKDVKKPAVSIHPRGSSVLQHVFSALYFRQSLVSGLLPRCCPTSVTLAFHDRVAKPPR